MRNVKGVGKETVHSLPYDEMAQSIGSNKII
jgi:hypothetical protein